MRARVAGPAATGAAAGATATAIAGCSTGVDTVSAATRSVKATASSCATIRSLMAVCGKSIGCGIAPTTKMAASAASPIAPLVRASIPNTPRLRTGGASAIGSSVGRSRRWRTAMSPSKAGSRRRFAFPRGAAGGSVRRSSSLAASALSAAISPASLTARASSRAHGGAYMLGALVNSLNSSVRIGALISLPPAAAAANTHHTCPLED